MKFTIAFVTALMLYAVPALAQQVAGDGQVLIPWGDMLASSANVLVTLACSVLALALARLPASLVSTLKTYQVDHLLERAISYGINMVAGAAKGQAMTVPTANKVIETALEYAVTNGSSALIKWMGGEKVIEQKIISRLDLVPSAGNITPST